MWSLSYQTYDNISVCSLGTLVISGVAGAAIFMGISQSGGISYHKQVMQIQYLYHQAVYDLLFQGIQ